MKKLFVYANTQKTLEGYILNYSLQFPLERGMNKGEAIQKGLA